MKNILVNYGGYILFYFVLVMGVVVLSMDAPVDNSKDLNEINYPVNY